MVNITMAREIAMIFPYDVSHEEYIFEENGFMKKLRKTQ